MASYAINTQTPVRDVVAKRAPRFFQLADDVAACCRAYIERKASMNLMDFDDMLMNWRARQFINMSSKSIRFMEALRSM